MAYTVKTTTSYGKRVSNSFKGIAGGFIAFLLGTILLFWNEGRYVARQKTIGEAQQKARHIDFDDLATVDADLDGRVIHASGLADTKEVLTDDLFGVSTVAIALERKVEYYQYVENSREEKADKVGGSQETTATYTYKPEWVGKPIDSGGFADPDYKASNKVLTTGVESKIQLSPNVTFGAYKLPKDLVRRISSHVAVIPAMTSELEVLNQRLGGSTPPASVPATAPAAAPATEAPAGDAPPAAAPAAGGWTPPSERQQAAPAAEAPAGDASPAAAPAAGGWTPPSERQQAAPAAVETPAQTPAAGGMVHLFGNQVYIGKSSGSPQIGDVRVTLTKVMPAEVSIIAEVSGKTFQAYTSSNGGEFLELRMGTVSKAGIIASARHQNTVLVWILRLVGTLLVIGGLNAIFGFITTLAKVVPFVASILGAGIGLVCNVLGFAWSLLIISLAWLFYRPLVGVPLVLAAVALIFYLKKAAAQKKAVAPPDGTPSS